MRDVAFVAKRLLAFATTLDAAPSRPPVIAPQPLCQHEMTQASQLDVMGRCHGPALTAQHPSRMLTSWLVRPHLTMTG
jgi:hypothetical protein